MPSTESSFCTDARLDIRAADRVEAVTRQLGVVTDVREQLLTAAERA